ncbi:hypothetical protein [Nocardioides panaciterrulae]|uniref:Uncharacterized protein n=1 Tax=Nocardioides panaciterrulae TaxID=661492 RepID=A0A7Y9E5G6_9ACTN|nr:hypothetical protein [Nocardioides panaciterrulae]NYD41599.1 hypothetical protein [Nocardioides panaciterrulae]
MTGRGGAAGPDGGVGSARPAWRSGLVGLVAIAAVWLTWWLAATITDRTGHADATYVVVFLGGPVALLASVVILAVAGARVVRNLVRRRRIP